MPHTPSRKYLYFTVFSAGMTTLAVELTASRLLGSYFGTSNLVWASIIGLILVYLTVGYFLGGSWADRSPHARTFYTLLMWGAFTAGLVPLVARPVLRFAAMAFDDLQVGVLLGSFLAVLILFSVPVTLLGTISPFAIRLSIEDAQSAGRVSGRIYAISTLGSFVGTFLPVLVFIPLLGTMRTFLTFSLLLLLVAYLGLWQVTGWRAVLPWLWMPVLLGVMGWLSVHNPLKVAAHQIYETESAYNYIQVLERDGYRYLRLNEGQGIHSQYHPTELEYYGPWMQFLAAPFFNTPTYLPEQVERIAIVGLAAGTTARQATAVFGPIPIDGFEIDPEIIEVGRRLFGMTMPNLNAIAADGRWGLENSPHRYTIIAVDAYRPPYIPWHLTTQEFFQIAREHLTDDGVLAVNVGRAPSDRRLIEALATTIATVFPSIYVMDVPGTFNSLIYATVQPTQSDNLILNLSHLVQRGSEQPLLLDAITRLITHLQPLPEHTVVFTDDRAPVEWMTNAMILEFILTGEMDILQ
ncbi:MAG: fused MFS/spermidine synthase [Chloroflexota bacterium]